MKITFLITTSFIIILLGCASTEKVKTTDTEILFDKASMYAEEGQYEQAIACYDKIIDLNSKNARAYGERGTVHAMKGNNDLALSDYSNAMALNPSCAILKQGLGISIKRDNRLNQVQNDFSKARKHSSQLKDAYENASDYCGTKNSGVYSGCMDNEYFCYKSFLEQMETENPNAMDKEMRNWKIFAKFLKRHPEFFCRYAIGEIGFCNFWIVYKSEL